MYYIVNDKKSGQIRFRMNFMFMTPQVGQKMLLKGKDYEITSITKLTETNNEFDVVGTLKMVNATP